MKYCSQFTNKINLSQFDEISIIYDKQDEYLVDFMQKHSNQKINLIIRDPLDFCANYEYLKLNTIKLQHPEFNFSICFYAVSIFDLIPAELEKILKKLEMPYFMGLIVTNFDQLQYLLEKGVSEVYLAEDICFDLLRVKRLCSRYGVTVRAFPNVGQCSVKAGPALKKFFIRPEDVKEYSDVIDTLEFWGTLDRQETLYEIYTSGEWFGDLKDLILDFDLSFDSMRIIPGFARARKTCGRKCMKGDRCTICDRMLSISKLLEERDFIIRQPKRS